MNTKLTLRLDEDLIRNAKRYSARSGKSLSQIVADYFALIAGSEQTQDSILPPTVRALHGALRGHEVDEADYRRHLEDRHR